MPRFTTRSSVFAVALSLGVAFSTSALAAPAPMCSDFDSVEVLRGEVWIDMGGLYETAVKYDEQGAGDIAKTAIYEAGTPKSGYYVRGVEAAEAIHEHFSAPSKRGTPAQQGANGKVSAVIAEVDALGHALVADYRDAQAEGRKAKQQVKAAEQDIADIQEKIDATDPNDDATLDDMYEDLEDAEARRDQAEADYHAAREQSRELYRDIVKADEGIDALEALRCQLEG